MSWSFSMNQAQQIFGQPAEGPRKKVRPFMVAWVQQFIQHSPFAVMASSNADGFCDASPKGGSPGFVKVIDDRHLAIPDVAGNKLFHTYENLETNPHIGLIFLLPGLNATARVNGSARILRPGDEEFESVTRSHFSPEEAAEILQVIMLEVHESYSHCPRALRESHLWDTERISEHVENLPIPKWVAGT